MGRTITLVSGKGGVGKTIITANLGIALSQAGFSVCLVDTDVAMANLSLLLNMQSSPITLHDVLLGEAVIHDAIYDGPEGTKVIPSGLSLDTYRRVDTEKLTQVIRSIHNDFDFILLDGPAGIGKDTMASIASADESILVTTPVSAAIADVLKTKIVCQRLGNKPFGVILNQVRKEKGEISDTDVSKMMELPVFGVYPYNENLRKAYLAEKVVPILIKDPTSDFSLAVRKSIKKMTGVEIKTEEKSAGILGLFKKSASSKETEALETPEKGEQTETKTIKRGFLDFLKKKKE
ncbi:MAG TPA: cell division ATPase MinD [archaeon]|nr:cell division ATPase MinD [archaeon]